VDLLLVLSEVFGRCYGRYERI